MCFARSRSLWSRPLARPIPLPAPRNCSSGSALLWPSLTSHVRSSSAMASRLPDADRARHQPRSAGHEISRFPRKEPLHMPGSTTTPGRPSTCDSVLMRLAVLPSVLRTTSAPGALSTSRLDGWPMHTPTNASRRPQGRQRKASGRCGSLILHRNGLSPCTPCRCLAHSQDLGDLQIIAHLQPIDSNPHAVTSPCPQLPEPQLGASSVSSLLCRTHQSYRTQPGACDQVPNRPVFRRYVPA